MFHGAGVFGPLGCSCSSDGLIQAEANQTIRATTNTKGAKKNPKVVTHLYHVCLIWRIGNLKWESYHRWFVQVMTTTDRNCFTEAFGKPSACLGAPVARSEHRHRSRNTCLHNGGYDSAAACLHRVSSEWSRWICGGRQYVRKPTDLMLSPKIDLTSFVQRP